MSRGRGRNRVNHNVAEQASGRLRGMSLAERQAGVAVSRPSGCSGSIRRRVAELIVNLVSGGTPQRQSVKPDSDIDKLESFE